ncbi:MAG: hypothetical protein A3D16_05100 [Rhodobacterales bacterium RIFCSPHIGHO2_02_FULL_62_130]|nr:MAG: hypothetical protein A3D16_05100 [Rhodobacterales bacterium RIFCSPHIGHO2_02_FULL_62_130]OHC55796.1 MAG: hypothetical protein A3E48_02380 [Rhodobacterales bacterium RIFCSPHIGHO2_12_FULL_62_75]HCY99412.1 hypothetical protein [Rhodobacter sp.]
MLNTEMLEQKKPRQVSSPMIAPDLLRGPKDEEGGIEGQWPVRPYSGGQVGKFGIGGSIRMQRTSIRSRKPVSLQN